jgi:hypothetical protein
MKTYIQFYSDFIALHVLYETNNSKLYEHETAQARRLISNTIHIDV